LRSDNLSSQLLVSRKEGHGPSRATRDTTVSLDFTISAAYFSHVMRYVS